MANNCYASGLCAETAFYVMKSALEFLI